MFVYCVQNHGYRRKKLYVAVYMCVFLSKARLEPS